MRTRLAYCLAFLSMSVIAGCGVKSTTIITKKDVDPVAKGVGGKNPVVQPAAAAIGVPEISLADPTAENPVVIGCAVAPDSLAPGSEAALFVKAKALAGWHFYAVDRPTGVNRPTKFDVKLPAGLSESGKWQLPEPHKDAKLTDETWTYDGEALFRLPIKVADAAAAGKAKIAIEISYQACKDEICKPPASVTIEVPVQIIGK